MKRHGRNLEAYYEVKEANWKGLYTVSFKPHDFLEKETLWRQ